MSEAYSMTHDPPVPLFRLHGPSLVDRAAIYLLPHCDKQVVMLTVLHLDTCRVPLGFMVCVVP